MSNYFVSVIIPVYNNFESLKLCLNALDNQTYPKEHYEVIVIDNNSTESIKSLANSFQQVRFASESLQGSYAARNKGVSLAKGEVCAFTDSDCVPTSQWIENGIKSMVLQQADLLGGNVKFSFSPKKTAAEIYDSITNIQIKRGIEQRKECKTANLFVYKKVFDSVGLFPSNIKSGGDVIWTQKATSANFKLVYASEAEVLHPARKFLSLVKKQYRIGNGQPYIWLEQNESYWQISKRIIQGLRPPSPLKFLHFARSKEYQEIHTKFVALWLIAWICRITTNIGRVNGLLKKTVIHKQ